MPARQGVHLVPRHAVQRVPRPGTGSVRPQPIPHRAAPRRVDQSAAEGLRRNAEPHWADGPHAPDAVVATSNSGGAIAVASALVFVVQQPPSAAGHYAGGASGTAAGHTALAGHLFRFLFSSVPQWVQIAGILIGVPVAIIVVWQLWKRRRRIWGWWLGRP